MPKNKPGGKIRHLHMRTPMQKYHYIRNWEADRLLLDAIVKGSKKGIVIRSLEKKSDGTVERTDTIIARFPKKEPSEDPKND